MRVAGAAARLAVLMPAHDEASVIDATLSRLVADAGDATHVHVVADNCSDATAAIARRHGVRVLERTDPRARGKGAALAWAIPRVLAQDHEAIGVMIVDADCLVDRGLCASMAAHIAAGEDAVQASYVADDPAATPAVALRAAALYLFNHVRPLGRSRLGLSAGLLGTGMAFSRDLLEREGWTARSATEDVEQHFTFLRGGTRVAFSAAPAIRSPLPTGSEAAELQERRWEAGKVMVMRTISLPALRDGLRHRNAALSVAAIEGLLPPFSLQVGLAALGCVLGPLTGSGRSTRIAGASLVGQVAFVLIGLRVARAPRDVFRALPLGAGLAARKLRLYLDLVPARAEPTWQGRVRTAT